MTAGFINERTAELILVPKLLESLKPYYSKITPLFYWVSREGGKISRESFVDKRVKLLVFYARRPKVEYAGSGIIQIKLNNILFERARQFNLNGIPVIAGFPIADKLDDLQSNMECIWLNIDLEGKEDIFEMNIASKIISSARTFSLSVEHIVNLIKVSKVYRWSEAIEKINEVRRSETADGRFYHYFINGDLYKPVYFLIHCD